MLQRSELSWVRLNVPEGVYIMELVSGAFGTLGSSDWILPCPRRCHLALLSWGIVSFTACWLAKGKMRKINMAGDLPREAGWQLTLPGGPSPKNLLVQFAGSRWVFAASGGGFVLADAYRNQDLERELV